MAGLTPIGQNKSRAFDNVVDRWHYRQYFSFLPQKTVKNLAGPGVGGGGLTLGTRTISI